MEVRQKQTENKAPAVPQPTSIETQTIHSTADSTSQAITENKISEDDGKLKELKIKNLESELKIKDKELIEINKKLIKQEKYLKQIEARYQELEYTVKTLNQKILHLEMTSHKDTGDQNINTQTPSRENENIMLAIHSKVINFILKQMDKQLETLSTNLNMCTSAPTVIEVNQNAPSRGEPRVPTAVEVNQKVLSKDESQMNASLNTNIVNQNIQNNGTI
ncbi:hypothetical protein DPMN_062524 [Dreissena polymorpha]|uniref:Uncharacterized protein n=1 Tax=Dreissena polymorpha TaxID=45954 RepID=A0A9D4C9W4_DREPO|nr:hypothetical protein DPMN_062524 [Dreissena polymorpha]